MVVRRMMVTAKLKYRRRLYIGFLVVVLAYILAHLLTLSRHPFVHSDENWLAVLTRAMLHERSISAVEETFRATIRYPHALKTLYHVIQAAFIAVSWTSFAARLPSLLAGLAVIFLSTKIARSLNLSPPVRYLPALLIAVDPQFWYASHIGRQEMLLTALMMLSVLWKIQGRRPSLVALPLMVAVFVHPNAFVVTLPVGLMYLPALFHRDNMGNRLSTACGVEGTSARDGHGAPGRNLLVFILFMGSAAIVALGSSFVMDTLFFRHYLKFGESIGAGDSLLIKILGLPRFLGKMWRQESGTYYLADARPFLTMGVAGFLGTFLFALIGTTKGEERLPISSLLVIPVGLLLGTVLVGKYGPPTLTFFLPPTYLLWGSFLSLVMNRWRLPRQRLDSRPSIPRPSSTIIISLIAVVLLGIPASRSIAEIRSSFDKESYISYGAFVKSQIDNNRRVLANLNSAFFFDYDRLVIWRDLRALPDTGMNLENFLDKHDVGWVILSDELELIYRNRPLWDSVYGNPNWYPELIDIVERRGTPVGHYDSPVYGMRIVPYMYHESGLIRIYRLNE